MSTAGNIAMGILRIFSLFSSIEINDPEQYLAHAQKYNEKHSFHLLKDHRAFYQYDRIGSCPCIRITSKKAELQKGSAILYLHGGITNDWEAEVMVARKYADHTGLEVWYPLYPSVTQAPASDVIEIIFLVYKRMTGIYGADHLALIGTSFGGTFGFGLICKINEENQKGKYEKIQMPSIYIANSPGGVPQCGEDWNEMEKMSRHDPLIHISAVKNILPMQQLLVRDIPAYANSPMYGNFSEAPETYVYYALETLAGNHSAYERGYQKYGMGRRMHLYIQPGMMHGYSCLPVFPESRKAYEEQIRLLAGIGTI